MSVWRADSQEIKRSFVPCGPSLLGSLHLIFAYKIETRFRFDGDDLPCMLGLRFCRQTVSINLFRALDESFDFLFCALWVDSQHQGLYIRLT